MAAFGDTMGNSASNSIGDAMANSIGGASRFGDPAIWRPFQVIW